MIEWQQGRQTKQVFGVDWVFRAAQTGRDLEDEESSFDDFLIESYYFCPV